MKTIRKILPLLLVWCVQVAMAQGSIGVTSFRLLETDQTANIKGSTERDQNGDVAALIKVATTEQGFVFDGGMVGIVKTRQEVGEIWVYVPHGIKKITIKHPQLGVLRDYWFPCPIEKARTYEMILSTGKVETIVTHSVNKQFVVFTVKPANASVELDGMPLEVDGEGFAEKSMVYGTYDYRVSCANYHTEAGKLTVSSAGKVEMNISLNPNFGWIDVKGTSEYHGAQVYIDGERIGQLPLKSGALKSGTYRVKVFKPLYKPFEQQVTVTDNTTSTLNISLVPNFANVTLAAEPECEIWIDGKQKGTGRWEGQLEIGEYNVECKRESHRTRSEVVRVTTREALTVQLPAPTPILSTLEVTSTPSRAKVYIDGIEAGETPLIKSDVLVGMRKVVLVKDGYAPSEKNIEIAENVNNILVASLQVGQAGASGNTGTSASGASDKYPYRYRSYADFFPVYGISLGKSTVADLKDKKYKVEKYSSKGDHVADVNDIAFWDHDADKVFEHIYMTRYDKMPDQWTELGMHWGLSYNDWVALFESMGFTIKYLEEPKTVKYQNRNTLSAKFLATSPDQTLSMELGFNYGNDNGEGYSVDSKNSLYNISIDLLRLTSASNASSPANAPSPAKSEPVGETYSEFFPVYGISLGKSTVADLEAKGYKVENWEGEGSHVASVNDLAFWDHNKDHVFEQIYMTYSDDMPPKWQELGLYWHLSYNEWRALLEEKGFTIKVTQRAKKELHFGRLCLDTEFVATSPDGTFRMKLDFQFRSFSKKSKSSLYSITFETLNK